MWEAARPPKVVGGPNHLGAAIYEESAVGNTTDVHGEPRVDARRWVQAARVTPLE